VVNVDVTDGPAASAGPNRIVRARVVRSSARGFVVQDAHGVVRDVARAAIRQVLRLPFTPRDLHDKFVMLKKQHSEQKERVEEKKWAASEVYFITYIAQLFKVLLQ
jgi:hypothetical protein